MFANRLSFTFDLKGPSFAVDTACSSSLLALALAYDSMRLGRCDSAIVAGVSLTLSPNAALQFKDIGMLSDDGKCKSFDATGTGYVRSECVSAVFLEKVEKPCRIYCEVVHARSNTDGYKMQGATFPSGEVQQALLEATYKDAMIDPNDVSYVEAHGTGTMAGDPQEVNAIENVLCTEERTEPLLIGSVKSVMGHAEPASGVASLAKVVGCMENGVLVPNLHYEIPNPEIPSLINGKIKVVTELTPWSGGYVGMNSFGFGGANVHVILKSHEDKPPSVKDDDHDQSKFKRLIRICGRTEEALRSMFDSVTTHADNDEYLALIDRIANQSASFCKFRGFALSDQVSLHCLPKIQRVESHEKRPIWFVYYTQADELLNKMSDQSAIEIEPNEMSKVEGISKNMEGMVKNMHDRVKKLNKETAPEGKPTIDSSVDQNKTRHSLIKSRLQQLKDKSSDALKQLREWDGKIDKVEKELDTVDNEQKNVEMRNDPDGAQQTLENLHARMTGVVDPDLQKLKFDSENAELPERIRQKITELPDRYSKLLLVIEERLVIVRMFAERHKLFDNAIRKHNVVVEKITTVTTAVDSKKESRSQDATRQRSRQIEEVLPELDGTVVELESAHSDLRDQADEYHNTRLDQARTRQRETRRTLENLNASLADYDSNVADLRKICDSLKVEIDNIETQDARLKGELFDDYEQKKEAADQFRESETSLRDQKTSSAVSRLEALCAALPEDDTKEAETICTRYRVLLENREEWQNKLDERASNHKQFDNRLNEVKTRWANLSDEVADLSKTIKPDKDSLEQMSSKLDTLVASLESDKKDLIDLADKIKPETSPKGNVEIQDEINQLQAQFSITVNSVTVLREQQRKMVEIVSQFSEMRNTLSIWATDAKRHADELNDNANGGGFAVKENAGKELKTLLSEAEERKSVLDELKKNESHLNEQDRSDFEALHQHYTD